MPWLGLAGCEVGSFVDAAYKAASSEAAREEGSSVFRNTVDVFISPIADSIISSGTVFDGFDDKRCDDFYADLRDPPPSVDLADKSKTYEHAERVFHYLFASQCSINKMIAEYKDEIKITTTDDGDPLRYLTAKNVKTINLKKSFDYLYSEIKKGKLYRSKEVYFDATRNTNSDEPLYYSKMVHDIGPTLEERFSTSRRYTYTSTGAHSSPKTLYAESFVIKQYHTSDDKKAILLGLRIFNVSDDPSDDSRGDLVKLSLYAFALEDVGTKVFGGELCEEKNYDAEKDIDHEKINWDGGCTEYADQYFDHEGRERIHRQIEGLIPRPGTLADVEDTLDEITSLYRHDLGITFRASADVASSFRR